MILKLTEFCGEKEMDGYEFADMLQQATVMNKLAALQHLYGVADEGLEEALHSVKELQDAERGYCRVNF